jgi:hypothetical protein
MLYNRGKVFAFSRSWLSFVINFIYIFNRLKFVAWTESALNVVLYVDLILFYRILELLCYSLKLADFFDI